MKYLALLSIFLAVPLFANTPGKHTVLLTWTDAGCTGCTYNVYRSTSGNACVGQSNPTPLATSISTTSWTDLNPPTATAVNYSVTAVSPGGESTCSSPEVQLSVPAITTPAPTVTGTVQ